MALKLDFVPGEKQRPPTKHELNDLTIAAHGIAAIARVMGEYATDYPGERESSGIFSSVFTVLEWLIEPVADYLDEYAGEPAAPEQEGADHA